MKKMVFAGILFVSAAAWAADSYELPAGEADAISTNVNYTTMNIAGDLTVSGGAKVSSAAENSTFNLIGGNLTISGAASALGYCNNNGVGTAFNVTNDSAGAYGKVIIDSAGSSVYNLNLLYLYIRTNAVDEVPAVVNDNGYLDLFELRGGRIHAKNTYNYSTLTTRVTVTAGSRWAKGNGYASGAGMFRKGAFLFDLKNGAGLRFDVSNQQGTFNDADVVVQTIGTGDVYLDAYWNNYAMSVRRGAYFNHVGALWLKDSKNAARFEFQTGDAIGPNVTRIAAEGGVPWLTVARGVTLYVPCDVALSATSTSLGGYGTLEMDCSEKPLSLSAMSGDYVTLLKTGSRELTVNSSLMANVRVQEGTLRFATRNCTVRDVRVEDGAELVVDGVTLTLDMGSGMALKCMRNPAFRTVNGGKLVYAGVEGTTEYLYHPQLEGAVSVQSGTLAASAWDGDSRKYWRFVFKGTASSPGPLLLRQLYLFDKDNHILNWGLSQDATAAKDDEVKALAAGKARWRFSSLTNLVNGGASWQDSNCMSYVFKSGNAGNNYPCLAAPVLNVDDPDSYLAVELRLKDDVAAVTGYTLGFAHKTKYANTWDVYASADGETWELVDAQAEATPYSVPDTYFTWDGWNYETQLRSNKSQTQMEEWLKQPFRFAGERVDGLAAAAPIQVQVDAGALLDLTAYTESEQVIDGLAFDGTLGGGTIKGGVLATEGRIDLTNYDIFANELIPLDLDGTADVANIEGWSVFVDGAAYPECRPTYDATEKKLSVNSPYAYLHVTETSTGDIQALYPDKSVIVEIDENANFTNSAALTGSKSIFLTGLGRFVLSQSSPDYLGTITVQRGRLDGRYDNAYGKGTVEIARGATGTCLVILGSATQNTNYDNDFVIRPAAGYEKTTDTSIWIVTTNQKTMTLNGDITAFGNLCIKDDAQGKSQGKNLVYFNGDVNADGWDINYPCDSYVNWKGRIVSTSFTALASYPQMGSHCLYTSENQIGKITCRYNSIRAAGTDVLGGAVYEFPNGYDTEISRGVLWLLGYSQTLSCLKGVPGNYYFSIDYNCNSASTLTLTGGVATATVSAALGRTDKTTYGKVSLVVDAGNDDFTQVFTNSVGTTLGTVTVKNGTLRFAGASSLTNAPSLAVTGGRLELETTKANAFAKVTSVTVGEDAALRVGASAVTPFGNGKKTVLTLDRECAIELPEGAAVTVNKAYWSDGVILPAGVYTGAEGADGDRTVLPQIRGAGTLTVLKGCGTLLLVR